MAGAFVGQNQRGRDTSKYLEGEFHGRGPCPCRQLCLEARISPLGSAKQLEHDRWHDERYVHGPQAESIPGPNDRFLWVGQNAQAVQVTARSSEQSRNEALGLFDRGVEEVYGEGKMSLGPPPEGLTDSTSLFVLMVNGRLAGVLPCRVGCDRVYAARWSGPMCVTDIRECPDPGVWTVLFAWVRRGYRGGAGAGAQQLINGAAELMGINNLSELAWQTPFTDRGANLVRRLLPGDADIRLQLHKPLEQFDPC